MTTPAQIQEAERLIQQKRAADNERRPKLRLVEDPELPESARIYWRENVVDVSRPTSEERLRQRRQEWAGRMLKPIAFKVPARYQDYTPRSLQKLCGKDYKAKEPAVTLMITWSNGELDRPGALITGDPGTGKTALVLWAVRRRAKRTGESAGLIRYGAFINAVQATYSNNDGPSKQQLMRAAQIADLMLIDDFGENALALGISASNDKQNVMREILDYRNMSDLPTVIVTNLSIARLQAQFGEDIISRLQEHCVAVEMNGVDLRRKGAVGW